MCCRPTGGNSSSSRAKRHQRTPYSRAASQPRRLSGICGAAGGVKEFPRYLQDADPGQWGLESVSASSQMTGGLLAYSHESMKGLRYKGRRRRKHRKRSHHAAEPLVHRKGAPAAATGSRAACDPSTSSRRTPQRREPEPRCDGRNRCACICYSKPSYPRAKLPLTSPRPAHPRNHVPHSLAD